MVVEVIVMEVRRKGGLTRCEGRVVEGGGWRGRHQEATRGCSRPSTAGDGGRGRQQAAAREVRKHAGATWLGAGQKRARMRMRMDAGGRRGGRAGVGGRGA